MNKFLFASVLASLLGCQSATLQEPARTSFFKSCMGSGFHVTTCECVEAAVVATGVKNDNDVLEPAKIVAAQKAINDSMAGCVQQTQKLIDATK
jgi:hypothetical protein